MLKVGSIIECQGIVGIVPKCYNNFACRLVTVDNEIINIFYPADYDYKVLK